MNGSGLAPSVADWLPELPCGVGEVLIDQTASGEFMLCHRDDVGRDDTPLQHGAEAAAVIARYDDAARYRPLKTAPNLRHGWRLVLADPADLRIALDLFYPGRLPAFFAWRRGDLATTPFRETLKRQTGMYRLAAKISDPQANELIANFCRSDKGCLRTILWRRDAAGSVPSTALPARKFDPGYDQTGRGEHGIPLLCQEICNLLVAEARNVVKAGGG